MHDILALDLGTTTGYALGDGRGKAITGTWDLKPSRHDGGGMRFVKFRKRLDEAHDALGFKMVVYEEVRRHLGTDAAHVYGGLMAHLTEWCEARGIPYRGIPVGTNKKFATGKGNASKEQMVEAVRSWGYEPHDDNEADAISLLHCQIVEMGGERPR